ncbi:MAG: PASTA domain-containing protein [Ignavibacteriaceae bacterium]|nr:PASTA domain-containing protein [Ignavibacteriaceae bacterium]
MNKLLQNPKVKKLLYFLGGLSILFLLFNYLLMPWFVYSAEVQVPKVVNLQQEEAIRVLDEAGLDAIIGDTTFIETGFAKNAIILQKPHAGEFVKKGRRIFLVLSGGEPTTVVPSIQGKSITNARFALERVGLKIGEIMEVSSDNPKDIIIAQQFIAGVKLKKGTFINVSVSTGQVEGEIEIPNLIGKSLTEAERILNESFLKVGKINYQPSFDLLPNTVKDQYPSPGSWLNQGDAVDLFITKNVETKEEITTREE